MREHLQPIVHAAHVLLLAGIVCIIISGGVCAAPAGSLTFQPFTLYPTGSWPEAVTTGRFSGDARADVALTTSFAWDEDDDHRVHLFPQTAQGALGAPTKLAAGADPAAVARGDLNGDGKDDLAVALRSEGKLGVLIQRPAGGFDPIASYLADPSPDAVAVGDFNGDARADVVVAHAGSERIALYYQQASGALASAAWIEVGAGGLNELAVGDLNSDGRDDLALLRGSGQLLDHIVILYQRNEALDPPVFRTIEGEAAQPYGLALGDVTNDGRDDLVATAAWDDAAHVVVFAQGTDGSLALQPIVYDAAPLPQAVEVADVNHDGRNDVIAAHAAQQALSVYLQSADGALADAATYPLPYTDQYRPGGLAIGDVNNDGGLDVLVANHSALADANGLVVLRNAGSAPTSTITAPAPGTHITQTVAALAVRGSASISNGTLEISTDGGRAWHSQPAATSWSYNWVVPPRRGVYVILARVTDAAGRVQAPPARTWVFVDRDPLPLFTWQQEAEAGAPAGLVRYLADTGASSCRYIYYDEQSFTPQPKDRICFTVEIANTDYYYLWALVRVQDPNHNSFFVYLDDQAPEHYEIVPADNRWGEWVWDEVHPSQQPIAGVLLEPGTHQLCFGMREANSQLDAVLLTNQSGAPLIGVTPCWGAVWTPIVSGRPQP